MGKITQEQRNRYSDKVKEYKVAIDAALAKEQSLLTVLKSPNTSQSGIVRVRLAEETLGLSSYYILVNTLSMALLGIKNEDYLMEARKSIARCLKYLEDIVTGLVDAPFSEYEKNLDEIADISYEDRYSLLNKVGFGIREIEDAYGTNSKWKWSFVELWGKLAVIAKNSLDLKKAYQDLDLMSPNRTVVSAYVSFIKRLCQYTADRFREKYEMATNKMDDFKHAIVFLNALKRLSLVLGERNEADELKKKIEIWSGKLESDQKKAEEAAKKR